MIKKRILCAFFALLMCALCTLPAFADPSETDTEQEAADKENTPLPTDPEPKEKLWADFDTTDGGWGTSDLSVPMTVTYENGRGGAATLEVNRYYSGGWRGVMQNFSPELDLFYYRFLSFDCFVSPIEDEEASYTARLVIRYEDKETEYKTAITAGEWNEVSFDISTLGHRHEISNIEISFLAESDKVSTTIERISVDNIELGGHAYEALVDRYMSEEFTAYGAEFDYSEEGHFSLDVIARAPTLEFDLLVRDPEDKNALLFVLDVKEECKNITLYYSETGSDFSIDRAVTLTAEPGMREYLFALPDGVCPKRVKLVFEGARSGKIDVFSASAVSVYSPGYDIFGKISTCEIASDKLSVVIKGSVEYDTALAYAGKKLELYALETYEDADAVTQKEPIATADMSSRFEFYLPISSAPDAKQRYAVCIKDGEGAPVFIDYPKYITNFDILAPSRSPSPATPKGVQTESVADAKAAGAGQVIIDVYINKILTEKSTGYLHTMGNAYYYYDMAYVDSLDDAVKQYHNTGTAVYLRLLMQDDTGALIALRTSSEESAARAAAAVDFLSSHYNGYDNGRITGFIIGKKIDLADDFNYFGKMSLSEYIEEYVRTLRLVYNTARLNNATIKVAVPLSDRFFTEDFSDESLFGGAYDKKLLISSLCSALSLGGDIDWLIMWENEEFFTELREDKICASNYYLLDSYLTECAGKYTEYPDSVLFFFEPEDGYDTDTLGAVYAYSYYTLLFEKSVSAFFVKINDTDLFYSLLPILKYIDTEKGADLTAPLLSYFDANSWGELVAGHTEEELVKTKLTETALMYEMPDGITGSAAIWDFSAAHSLLGWQAGCGARTAAYSRDGEDAFLSAVFDGSSDGSVIYAYETPEELDLFDLLSFDISVTDGTYENAFVSVTLGGDGFVIESTAEIAAADTVSAEKTTLFFDLSSLPEGAKVRYIEISAESPENGTSLRLYNVKGHSRALDDASLALALEAPAAASEPEQFNSMWIVIIATVAIASIAAVIMIARKE